MWRVAGRSVVHVVGAERGQRFGQVARAASTSELHDDQLGSRRILGGGGGVLGELDGQRAGRVDHDGDGVVDRLERPAEDQNGHPDHERAGSDHRPPART